ncbi:MAG: hypothetical protein JXA60_01845 [Candidatus Coatesbacteria bacterium]|nr:hypothetical protein [Candidatus Coatesbacteria bacterium]
MKLSIPNNTYKPFGSVVEGGEAIRYGYEGKEYDSLVGDTDFHFRKYKPGWDIYLQPDTLIQNVYDPQLLNRYSFERNNPYKYTDEDGHLFGGADFLDRMWEGIKNFPQETYNWFKSEVANPAQEQLNNDPYIQATKGIYNRVPIVSSGGKVLWWFMTEELHSACESCVSQERLNKAREEAAWAVPSLVTDLIAMGGGSKLLSGTSYEGIGTLSEISSKYSEIAGRNLFQDIGNLLNSLYNNILSGNAQVNKKGGGNWGGGGSRTGGSIVTTNTGVTLDASPGFQQKMRDVGLI